MRQRRGASPGKIIVTAVIILFFVGMVGIVSLLFVPGVATTMTSITGVNFNKAISSLGFNQTEPIGVTVETNNTTLAKLILTEDGAFQQSELQSHALILQPNTEYVFNITIVPANYLLQPLNTNENITVKLINGAYENGRIYDGGLSFASFGTNGAQSLYGITPIHTVLTINLPPDSNDTIFIATPSGVSGEGVYIFAET